MGMGLTKAKQAQRSVVVPGNHDGVHRGHQALLARAQGLAAEASQAAGAEPLPVVALFFQPHPLAVLRPEQAPLALTTVARRQQLLRHWGASDAVARRFTPAFAKLSAEAFFQDILRKELGACGVVVGADFRFGAERRGDVALLQRLCEHNGVELAIAPQVQLAGGVVSSTRVRQALGEGDLALATALLGRYPELSGKVVPGDQRGRTLGFPTANLDLGAVVWPAFGVYAAWAASPAFGGKLQPAVVNIGARPTFAAGRACEAHVLGGSFQLYDQMLTLYLCSRLRGEVRFASAGELCAQIDRDCAQAAAALVAADTGLVVPTAD